jgi:nitrogen regulatory protein P-II 1
MKLIIAIIQPSKLEAVKAALTEVEVFRLTVMDCQGFGRQKGQTEVYRGQEFAVNLLRKVQLQIAVNEDFVEPTINAVLKGARTGEKGEIGDGKIFVLPLEDCVRIRTDLGLRRIRSLEVALRPSACQLLFATRNVTDCMWGVPTAFELPKHQPPDSCGARSPRCVSEDSDTRRRPVGRNARFPRGRYARGHA